MKKMIALLLALVMALSVAACGKNSSSTPSTSIPSSPSTPTNPTKDPSTIHELYRRPSYTGDAKAVLAARDTVVATMGDAQLTSGMLQIYYWMGVYEFLSTYGSYVSQLGLDINKPLDEQAFPDSDGTWQHYFLDNALGAWRYQQAIAMKCDATGTPISPGYQETLDTFYDDLTKSAVENGFASIDAMIQSDMGVGCTSEDYYNYSKLSFKEQSYINKMIEDMDITDEMIEEYFTENEAALAVNGITKSTGESYRVRHILYLVDEKKTDDDWETCRQKAQKLLDDWLAGDATEDSFAELAKEHSEDPGSQAAGGLYTGLSEQTSFVQEFKDWYLDDSRQIGDYGLVKTDYGYHIMYFSGTEPIWVFYCRESLVDERSSKLISEIVEKLEPEIDYEKILLGDVKLTEEK